MIERNEDVELRSEGGGDEETGPLDLMETGQMTFLAYKSNGYTGRDQYVCYARVLWNMKRLLHAHIALLEWDEQAITSSCDVMTHETVENYSSNCIASDAVCELPVIPGEDCFRQSDEMNKTGIL